MSLLQCSIYSHVLGREVSVNVIMPHASKQFEQGADIGRVPVLYLLHGLTENHSTWLRKSAIERYVAGRQLAVVMPDGGRDFYTDTKSGIRWFEFLTVELPKALGTMLSISDKREDTFVAGLSMGGYGAFKAALMRPDLYSCAASLSGAVDISRVTAMGDEMPEVRAAFGEGGEYAHDLYDLAKNCTNMPALYQSCGTTDFLYADNIRFRDFIKDYAKDYTFDEAEFDHCWEFWDIQIYRVIDWISEHNGKI